MVLPGTECVGFSGVPDSSFIRVEVMGTAEWESPPEVEAAIGRAIADEMRRNWQNDDDVMDSFGRVAALAYTLGKSRDARVAPEMNSEAETVRD